MIQLIWKFRLNKVGFKADGIHSISKNECTKIRKLKKALLLIKDFLVRQRDSIFSGQRFKVEEQKVYLLEENLFN